MLPVAVCLRMRTPDVSDLKLTGEACVAIVSRVVMTLPLFTLAIV